MFEFAEEAGAAWAMRDWLLEHGAVSAIVLQVADGYLVLWSSH